MILVRIIEKLLILYFALYLLIDIYLYLSAFAIFAFRRKKSCAALGSNEHHPPVSVIVPAYNEEVSLVLCTRMLLDLDYKDYQVIVVNDGSKDSTLEKMLKSFDFAESTEADFSKSGIATSEINKVFYAEGGRLVLVDKINGGKADAINAALNIAKGDFICTIDADSILDRDALQRVVLPLVKNEAVFVSGGQLALSNDLTIKNNRVVSAKMPRNIWVHWQILEYISTFMVARISLSRINALLIMSGAFSIFRKKDLIEVGGFLTSRNDHPYIIKNLGVGKHTITEDMEIVLRLWKFYRDKKRKAKAVFLPGPVCWTEAPEKPSQLFKQRVRWHQGLAETLWLYRHMIFEPRYRVTGLLAIPYYFFLELIAPVIKLFTIIFVSSLVASGLLNQQWVILMILGTILIATIIMSSITVMIENWSMHQSTANREALRYKTVGDWALLLGSGIVGNFSYSFYRMFAQMKGIINYFKKRQDWNKLERKGIIESRE